MTGSSSWAAALRCFVFSLLTILSLPALAGAASDGNTQVLWVAAGGSVFKISPLDSMPSLELAAPPHIQALTIDQANNHVWLYSHKHLWAYDAQGNLLLNLDIPRNFHGGKPVGMAVDSAAGNIWIGIQKKLYRLDLNGDLTATLDMGRNIRGLAFDSTRSHLWIAEDHDLIILDKTGGTLFTVNLDRKGKPIMVTYDAYLHQVWVASQHGLSRYDEEGVLVFDTQISNEVDLDDFLVADGQGGLWGASERTLVHFDQSGLLEFTLQPFVTDPDEDDIRKITGLVADPRSHTAWVANHRYLKQYEVNGNFLKIIDSRAWMGDSKKSNKDDDHARGDIYRVAFYAGVNAPKISITEPRDLSYIKYAQPVISITYVETGSGIDPATIAIKSNGIPVQITCQTSADGAQCIPIEALPDGNYTFSATIADYMGQVSEPAMVTFVIDTVPPPLPIGSLLGFEVGSGDALILAGQVGSVVSDAMNVTVSNIRTGETVTGTVNADGSFSIQVPGRNSDAFTIVLTDLAGNEAPPLYMHGSDVPLQLSITSPAAESAVAGNMVNVTGTFHGALNSGITVNGIPAVLINDEWAANNIPLTAGVNTLTAIATTAGGLTVTQTLEVTSVGTTPLILNVAPASSGIAPFPVTFQYQFLGEATPQDIRIDYTGNGNYVSVPDPTATLNYTYPTSGVYPVTLILTDSSNAEYQAHLLVVVQEPSQMDALFQSIWGDLTTALASSNKAAAMHVLDGTAQRNYGSAFDTLIPHMQDIVDTFSPLLRSSISGSIGEYAIVRPWGGHQSLFFIYFLKDQDGIWRLDAM
ncbi:MAG: hypothetical protein ACYDCJ_10340 [Gammaproteobacteria bacterium]